ncbi:MipA/OmpV family protein [Novosphingobium sp.]|uniref:MipA/OmpV family protein n=1 Tax=Novosphingobium sp. TaxID=1874826 RepID=UPI0035AE5C4D
MIAPARIVGIISFIALASGVSPAHAQRPEIAEAAPAQARGGSDRFTVGLGLGVSSDYEGADEYRLVPGGLLQGRIGDVEVQMRGLNLYSDFIADPRGQRTTFAFGPVVQLRLERTGDIKDPRVAALGKRDTGVEVGLVAGVGRRGVLFPPDRLSFDVTVLRDVAGAHDSTIITPSLSYAAPVSQRAYARISLSADHVGSGFARTYFDVAPSAAPGALPAYATSGGGWKSASAALLYTRDLGGDPRAGLGLFSLVSYKRLLGQFADSPIVRDAGSAHQGFGMVGLSYSF